LRATILSSIEAILAGRIVTVLVGTAAGPGAPEAGLAAGWSDLVLAAAAVVAVGLAARFRWYRLPGQPLPAPIAPEAGLGIFAAMIVLGYVGAKIAGWMIFAGGEVKPPTERTLSESVILLTGYLLGMALASAGCLVLQRRAPRQRPGPGRSLLIGAAATLLLWPVMTCVSTVAALIAGWVRGQAVDAIAHTTLRQLAATPSGAWPALMAILVVLVVPVLEEVMYRGLLQRAIAALDLGRFAAIGGASAIFVLMHLGTVSVHALPALLLLSLGLGWTYERTGRLAAPIAMHVLFNALNLALARLVPT
jgi:membrane protease YdiL (CAAX protease family)